MKTRTEYVCQHCGASTPRWSGKCAECGEWNTLIEEVRVSHKESKAKNVPASVVRLGDVATSGVSRLSSGIAELDHVLGGGITHGSVVLVGGDPGIGKSTLMMQMLLAMRGGKTLYVTGEESLQQIRMRVDRLEGAVSDSLYLCAETNMDSIAATLETLAPAAAVIDSIQTMCIPVWKHPPEALRRCASAPLCSHASPNKRGPQCSSSGTLRKRE